jgi:hypothetical protein
MMASAARRTVQRYNGINSSLSQSLRNWRGIDRNRHRPVDLELRWLERHRRELLGIGSDPPITGNCGMQLGGTAIFCDTFDTKNPGIPSRTGDLDPNVWGVSRATGFVNFRLGYYNGWAGTQPQSCSGTINVTPPNDVMICSGQLREASNDNPPLAFEAGNATTLAMYPKQRSISWAGPASSTLTSATIRMEHIRHGRSSG